MQEDISPNLSVAINQVYKMQAILACSKQEINKGIGMDLKLIEMQYEETLSALFLIKINLMEAITSTLADRIGSHAKLGSI